MAAFAAERFGVAEEQVVFRDDRVFVGNESLSFAELAQACVSGRVQLSEAGFYKTPEDHLGPAERPRPAVLLLRLRRRLRRGRRSTR